MQAMQSPLTCTVTEMAALLGISRSKAYACVRTGIIPAIHIGRRVVVPRRVVDELLKPASPPVPGTAFPPTLAGARILEAMSVSRADDTLIRLVRQRREEILAAGRRRGAHNVRLFGSLARGDAHAGSDVDFLVDFEPGRSLLDVSGLILDLEELLGVRVDVVEASALRSRDAHVLDDAVSL
jgi:excisionase family DNA binding protein